MNIYLAFSLFALIILGYWVISELFSLLFRFTGLPEEKARFQVISLLTGCGFTTHESELLLSTRSRRRLARLTMLFGYVFNLTIVSAFINVFFSLKVSELAADIISSIIPLSVVLFILAFIRVPKVRAWGDRLIEKLAGRIIHEDTSNTVWLMDYIGEDTIAQVTLYEVPEELKGVPLSASGLKTEQNILVMLVEPKGGKAEPAGADTVFQPEDKLTVFGNYAAISRVFRAQERFSEQ
ncbi:MAG: TrkA C-terminal domain-containing protein [Clostridia bacterium]|nr:TrkA C-terminal domain-containing protein [Clostridia bacterium]